MKMKCFYSLLFIVLFVLPVLPSTNISFDTNTFNPPVSVSKLSCQRTVDISLVGNVYLSKPDIVNGELVDIYGVIYNDANYNVSSYILFTVKNESWEQDITGQRLTLTPNEERYVKTTWMAVSGTYEIIIHANPIDYHDNLPENNLKSTIVTILPEPQEDSIHQDWIEIPDSVESPSSIDTQENLDVLIFDKKGAQDFYEIIPGDTKTLEFTLLSNEMSDEYRIIVGGITHEINIKPDIMGVKRAVATTKDDFFSLEDGNDCFSIEQLLQR